ncbi:MAG: triose-phosphate isomerase [Candidatus Puniceispirillaceae bacterium]
MIIAGNWKMNPNHAAAIALLEAFAAQKDIFQKGCQAVCFPPASYHAIAAQKLAGTDMEWGAQTCHQEQAGAYTGEISPQMIADMGGKWVIIGHSERRQYFGETDSLITEKIDAALTAGLRPVLCVGEPEEVRLKGEQDDFVQGQMAAGLKNIAKMALSDQKSALGQLVIAYEPVWAIGTGKVASLQNIAEMHQGLCDKLVTLFGTALPEKNVPVLYGGSVNRDNAAEILAIDHVSGALVGGASLQAEGFLAIYQAAIENCAN